MTKPPEYLTDINQLHRLPKKIIHEHPRGYVGVFVEGSRRIGKTAFCMKTAHEVFQFKYGLDREDAWKMVLKNICFDIKDVDSIFEPLERMDTTKLDKHWLDEKPICKIWDDVGMHGGKYRFLVDARYVDYLQQNLDIIGIALTGFLMNAPELSGVLSFLREYHDHEIVRIGYNPDSMENGEYERVAFFNNWRKEKNGWHLRPDRPHTPFSCFIGNVDQWSLQEQWVYDEYEKMKVDAIRKNRGKMKRLVELAEKDHPDLTKEQIADGMGVSYKEIA